MASTCPGIEFLPRGDGRTFAPISFALTKHGLQANTTSRRASCALWLTTIDQRLGAIFPTSHCHKGGLPAENIVATAPFGLKKNFTYAGVRLGLSVGFALNERRFILHEQPASR